MDMQIFIFPAILLGVMLIFLAIFLIITKKQKKKASINTESKVKTGNKSTNTSSSNNKDVTKEDVFNFMEFDKILNNMIVQNDGTKFTMAIKCKGINYDLMSEMEQIAVEEGFITFLNTLRYPIQLYVQAQNIDLKAAINTYKHNARNIQDEYEEINKTYTDLLDQFDAKEEDIKVAEEKRERVLNVYEYANDIINYVEKLSLNKNLLQRNFYVLVSYYSSEITTSSSFSKEEIINICYNELLTRAQSIIGGLSTCSVSGIILNSNELADLLYTAYNRDDKGLVSVREAIESGFYRLYSTSEDVFYKKQEKLLEQINEEAELKALQAMKLAIEEGKYVSKAAEKLDIVEKVSKTAAEIVKKEDLPQEIKEKAKKILVDDYVINKTKIIEEEAKERDEKKSKTKVKNKEAEEKKESLKEVEEIKPIKQEEKEDKNIETQEAILDDRMGFDQNTYSENVTSNSENKSESSSGSSEDDLII